MQFVVDGGTVLQRNSNIAINRMFYWHGMFLAHETANLY